MKSPSGPEGVPGGADQNGQAHGASETGATLPSPGPPAFADTEEAWIVVEIVPSRRAAERSVVHLGGAFRRQARRGWADAFVVTGDQHGTFQLVQSRFVTANGLVAAVMKFSASIMVGFHGVVSVLKGVRSGAEAVRARETRVGAGAERVRELLGEAGEHKAGLVIRCTDDVTVQHAEARAAQHAIDHWCGSRSEFLAALEHLGSAYDWLRPAADGHGLTAGRRRRLIGRLRGESGSG
ncbi:hypothetical protein [Catenulispora subtropica]